MVSAMDAAPAIAKDGFNQAFGLLAPAVRGPQARCGGQAGLDVLLLRRRPTCTARGSVGPDDRFLVVLLTRQPRAVGWDGARRELNGIATAAVQPLG